MCMYCEEKKPLTDKVYDDGSLFDDSLSTRIVYLAGIPTLISEVKKSHFWFPFLRTLSEDARNTLPVAWCVDIDYCPKCGRDLRNDKDNENNN